MEAAGFAFFIAIGAIGTAFLLGPMGRSIAKRIAGRDPVHLDDDATARLAEVEQRLVEAEQSSARIAELEERLDFAERMLSRPGGEAQDSPRLPQ